MALYKREFELVIIPVAETHKDYADKVEESLKEAGVRVEISDATDTLGKRIRNAKLQKVPYLLIIGDKEIEAGAVSVESRDAGNVGSTPLASFVEKIVEEIKTKALKSVA